MKHMSKGMIARIIPPPIDTNAPCHITPGTRVMVGDTELKGVTRIEVVFELNDVVRARIECLATMDGVNALIDEVTKAKRRMTDEEGVEDITHLGSTSCEFSFTHQAQPMGNPIPQPRPLGRR